MHRSPSARPSYTPPPPSPLPHPKPTPQSHSPQPFVLRGPRPCILPPAPRMAQPQHRCFLDLRHDDAVPLTILTRGRPLLVMSCMYPSLLACTASSRRAVEAAPRRLILDDCGACETHGVWHDRGSTFLRTPILFFVERAQFCYVACMLLSHMVRLRFWMPCIWVCRVFAHVQLQAYNTLDCDF